MSFILVNIKVCCPYSYLYSPLHSNQRHSCKWRYRCRLGNCRSYSRHQDSYPHSLWTENMSVVNCQRKKMEWKSVFFICQPNYQTSDCCMWTEDGRRMGRQKENMVKGWYKQLLSVNYSKTELRHSQHMLYRNLSICSLFNLFVYSRKQWKTMPRNCEST